MSGIDENEDGVLEYVMEDDMGIYLRQRRFALAGPKQVNFAQLLGMSRQQLSNLMSGRSKIRDRLIERLNEVDPDFDLKRAYVIVRKQSPTQGS